MKCGKAAFHQRALVFMTVDASIPGPILQQFPPDWVLGGEHTPHPSDWFRFPTQTGQRFYWFFGQHRNPNGGVWRPDTHVGHSYDIYERGTLSTVQFDDTGEDQDMDDFILEVAMVKRFSPVFEQVAGQLEASAALRKGTTAALCSSACRIESCLENTIDQHLKRGKIASWSASKISLCLKVSRANCQFTREFAWPVQLIPVAGITHSQRTLKQAQRHLAPFLPGIVYGALFTLFVTGIARLCGEATIREASMRALPLFLAGLVSLPSVSYGAEAPRPASSADGSMQLPAFTVPYSMYASPESLQRFRQVLVEGKQSPGLDGGIEAARSFYDKINSDRVERMKKLYPVKLSTQTIAGVGADVAEPTGGISPANRNRVLINLHGGGFLWGAHSGALVEAIPVAAVGKIKVIGVDYRQGPEHVFPAASDDVVAVYKALLKTYPAANIGIYGCSAGGMLTGEVVARLIKDGVELPGAIGTFCGSICTAPNSSSAPVAVGRTT